MGSDPGVPLTLLLYFTPREEAEVRVVLAYRGALYSRKIFREGSGNAPDQEAWP